MANAGTHASPTDLGAAMTPLIRPIPLAEIQDGGAQMRVEIVEQTVLDYAEDMVDGAKFPPVIVYFDGASYSLADGFHRRLAAEKIGLTEIDAEVHEGTARDAVLHGAGANAAHGLRRTQADKWRAIETLIRDEEWSKWSDRKVAKVARVDHKTVAKVRREILCGEIPTPKAPTSGGGEIPTSEHAAGHDRQSSAVADLLRSLPDDAVVEECRRRGLTVESSDA